MRQALGGAVDVYRSYFAQMKENFRDRGNEIAAAHITRASELADVPDLLRARILEGDRVVDEWAQPPEVQAADARGATDAGRAGAGAGVTEPRILELTFGISREIYANFLALREATEKEHDLDRVLPLILPRIVRGLGIALLVVLAFATILGLGVARRATGRVAALRDAAHRVGAGDLSVRVAPRGKDELDELARAFDVMVAELGDARSRLGYLQKVSAWQEVARRLAHEIKNPLTPIQLAVQELGSKYKGDDPVYRRLLATAQEILNEEVGRDPPPRRRFLGVREAAQGRTGARRSRPGRRGLRARAPRVAGVPDASSATARWARCAIGCCCATCWRTSSRTRCRPPRRRGASRRSGSRSTASPAERGARLTVDDNGPGVPADARERIFDPYVTTQGARHRAGTGDRAQDRARPRRRRARRRAAVAARRGALRGHVADRDRITYDAAPLAAAADDRRPR